MDENTLTCAWHGSPLTVREEGDRIALAFECGCPLPDGPETREALRQLGKRLFGDEFS